MKKLLTIIISIIALFSISSCILAYETHGDQGNIDDDVAFLLIPEKENSVENKRFSVKTKFKDTFNFQLYDNAEISISIYKRGEKYYPPYKYYSFSSDFSFEKKAGNLICEIKTNVITNTEICNFTLDETGYYDIYILFCVCNSKNSDKYATLSKKFEITVTE